jgi:hypothetical protein
MRFVPHDGRATELSDASSRAPSLHPPASLAAYALLGAMPMIMITGQKGIMKSRQAGFQIVDVVSAFKSLTKMSRQIVSTEAIPTRSGTRFGLRRRNGRARCCWSCPKTLPARRPSPSRWFRCIRSKFPLRIGLRSTAQPI